MRCAKVVARDDLQLELFSFPARRFPPHEAPAPLGPDGRSAPSPVPVPDAGGTGAPGPVALAVPGGGGAERGGTGCAAPALGPAGPDTPARPRPALADRSSALSLPAAGEHVGEDEEWVPFGPAAAEPEPVRNRRNYRIPEADHLGAGSLKRKCEQNLAAIELLKRLEAQ